jgi:hypothetical protein
VLSTSTRDHVTVTIADDERAAVENAQGAFRHRQ